MKLQNCKVTFAPKDSPAETVVFFMAEVDFGDELKNFALEGQPGDRHKDITVRIRLRPDPTRTHTITNVGYYGDPSIAEGE